MKQRARFQPIKPTGHNNLEMMKNPNSWPNWPILPIKQSRRFDQHGLPRIAVLIGGEDWWKVAYDVNMWQIGELEKQGKVTWLDITPEALIADGWIVD